mmetsp:Transcript_49001/g.116567  ORF Transcript_49001/g.116567 Transcript_49001/m.116567 type:complete len:392 (+) Transcript_49001:52-1227(+)
MGSMRGPTVIASPPSMAARRRSASPRGKQLQQAQRSQSQSTRASSRHAGSMTEIDGSWSPASPSRREAASSPRFRAPSSPASDRGVAHRRSGPPSVSRSVTTPCRSSETSRFQEVSHHFPPGSRTTEDISSQMMEALGLREDYAQLRTQSSNAKHSLQRLLVVRDSLPSRSGMPVSKRPCCGVADLLKWQKAQFFPVADKHISQLHQLIESFAQLEEAARERLRDKEAYVSWRLASAVDRLSEFRLYPSGNPDFLPRRAMVESPELSCHGMNGEGDDDLTVAVFRVYPAGDAMAAEDNMSVYIWLDPPPLKNFAFDVAVGTSCRTTPRLWKAGQRRHRLDVPWSGVQRSLEGSTSSSSMEIKLQILQWFPLVNTDSVTAPTVATRGAVAWA